MSLFWLWQAFTYLSHTYYSMENFGMEAFIYLSMKSTIVYFFQNPHTEAEGANIKKTKPKGKGYQEN